MTRVRVELGLRTAAIAIALAAVVDPAITSNRATKPVVSVIAGAPDAALADRVERVIGKSATVVRAPTSLADASVFVGDALPTVDDAVPTPAFVVFDDRAGTSVVISSLSAPPWTPKDARAPIAIDAHVTHARGKTMDVMLRAGDLVVDRTTRRIASDDEHAAIALGFIPTAAGAASLRISARIDGSVANADAVVDVRDKRWAVLFFDPRPSWMSTFARRALEDDSRFVVTSRVVTSRNVSTDAGAPPSRLDDLAALALFDVVVVGAPEALTQNDVAALDAFMRRRGGSVVMLADRRAAGPYDRLTQVASWSADSGKASTIETVSGDSGSLRSSEIAWPTHLPDGADAVARTGARPVVWRSPIGAGQLIVSGALDAWRFRDQSASGFNRFWRSVIADAAVGAPSAIDVAIDRGAIAPSGSTNVSVILRDAALSSVRPIRATVSATLEATGKPTVPVRLWPGADIGEFRGTLRGTSPGIYRLVVASGGARASSPIVVVADAAQPALDARDVLSAFANAHGGRALSVSELPSALRDAIHPTPRLETWHPMRSAWWIVPFALALSGEWWIRRRKGRL